jgi:glycosyltransferase involved in cell wall biosynthesis
LKIGFVYDAVYPWIKGGGEKTLYELACELRDRGHECHFFGMQCWPGPADMTRDGLHYHAVCPNIPLYGPDGKRRISQPLRFAWGVLTRLGRHDLRTFDILDVHAFPFFSVPAFWIVRRLRAAKLPWLLTWLEVWGRDYWSRYAGRKGFIGAWLERWCARAAPHHLCISETTARRLRELLAVPRDRITVIPRGFAGPPAFATAPIRVPGRIVIAGRLLAYKRTELILAAWPSVVERVPHAVLHVVGDGPELSALKRLADQLKLGESVRFLGQLAERDQVLAEIAAAELLLQPSIREGQSTVVLEALMLGTPVVAAVGDETAVGDFLGDPQATALARIGADETAEAWSQRIVQLLCDSNARAQLASAGSAAVKELGWRDHIAPAVEQLYERQIAVQSSGR